jgi:hypothetical protein
MAVIIEVLGWGGKRKQFYRLDGPSIAIGRSYQNDVVLGDAHVSANHLRLDLVNDGWQVTDLQSLNGVEILKRGHLEATANPSTELIIGSGAEIKIGRTRLRIVNEHQPVDEAKRLHRLEAGLNGLNRWSVWLPIAILAISVDILSLYLSSFVEWQWKNIVMPVLLSQAILMLVAGVFGILGRFLREESHFLGHYSLLLIAGALFSVGEALFNVAGYNFNAPIFDVFVIPLFGLLLLGLLLSAMLALASNLLPRQRWSTSLGFVILLLVVSMASRLADWGEFSAYPDYFSGLEVPSLHFTDGASLDDYTGSLDDLFTEADRTMEDQKVRTKKNN